MGRKVMSPKPDILFPKQFTTEELKSFREARKIWRTVDIYDQQITELTEITHPGDDQARRDLATAHPSGELAGAWVYYPWSGVLVHTVGAADLFALRTNRNKNLITVDEQNKLADSVVAVAGMSVGSGIALASVYSGISNTIKIADFDTLETANLNRLREGLPSVGSPKAALAAQHIYELNPFADVRIFEEGLDKGNIEQFFTNPKTSVVVDEIDDFKMKVQLRLSAKAHGVPLLMFTSLGDNILIDIERYDLDPTLAIFNGAIGEVPEEILQKQAVSLEDAKRYAVRLVGQEYVPTRAMGSLPEMGKTLVGRPQLYSTIAVDGGLAAYVIKQIVLGAPIKSGRYFVKFAELVGLPATDLADCAERQSVLQKLFG